MATTTATSTAMVNAVFTNTGQLLTDFVPLLYLFLGVFMFLFAYRIFVGSLRKGIRNAGGFKDR